MKNLFKNINDELVTCLWVISVLLLIICSYVKNEYVGFEKSCMEIYQASSDVIIIE